MARAPRKPQASLPRKQPNADGIYVMGRYTPQLAQRICEKIAEGKMWHKIANTDGLPAYTTLYQWRAKYPAFAEALAQAREMAAEMRADQVLEAAEAVTKETATADRVKIGALQWYAAGQGAPKPGRAGKGKAARDDDGAGGEGGHGGPQRLIIEVRRFERVVGEDGKAYVRELKPRGPRRGDGR
jgi:hypothetical protein